MAIRRLLKKFNPEVVLIQETKQEDFNLEIFKSLWSLKEVGWFNVEAYGGSGGILTMWDKSKVSVIEVLKGGYSLCQMQDIVQESVLDCKRLWTNQLQRKELYLAGIILTIRLYFRTMVHWWRLQYNLSASR